MDRVAPAPGAGAAMTPVSAWMLAESSLTSVRARSERAIVLVLDACAAPPAAMDESVPLSEYLAHLARAVWWARCQAVSIETWIVGDVDAASLVACKAAAVDALRMSPGAADGHRRTD
jgi:hypothetical protein